jgi:L-ribulokinase
LESIAFGTRAIVEAFRHGGVPIEGLVAVGGVAAKSPLLMQITADVTQMTITVPDSDNTAARGSAVLASVAAGVFASADEAVTMLAPPPRTVYDRRPAEARVYDEWYSLYEELYRHFGERQAGWMHQLRRVQRSAIAGEA